MTTEMLKNGKAAAALLAGGIGALAMGLLTVLSEASSSFGSALNWYNPVGNLSGKSILAIVIWLITWAILNSKWKDIDVDFDKYAKLAFVLLWVGILFTFPPFFQLFK